MKKFYKHYSKKILLSGISLFASVLTGFTQVGFDNPNPDSSALIDMKAKDKGLLVPRMTTNDRANMASGGKKPAHALLVFDLDQNMFFVYDTISNPDKWTAMNPFQTISNTGNIITNSTGNVGIGTSAPSQKLEVNGNIKADNNLIANGNLTAVNANFSGSLNTATISSGNINSTGTVTATGFSGGGVIPIGGIIMWAGSIASIPAGWALCDGSNSTPDLRGRFIVGFDAGKSTTPVNIISSSDHTENYGAVNNTGGYKEILLTANESGIREHVHVIHAYDNTSNGIGWNSNGSATTLSQGGSFTDGIRNVDGVSGRNGSQNALSPHENRPPYYVLAFIIRIQ